MASIKQKRLSRLISMILCILLLTDCAPNPEKEVVTSKNDGSFDANVVQSATTPSEEQGSGEERNTITVQYTDSFTSTDGTVEFTLNIDKEIPAAGLPVVEVVPHTLTSEDVKRVANILFGDAEFYEATPMLAPVYSKSEIQERLNRWSQYITVDALEELLGERDDGEEYYAEAVEVVKKFIEEYTLLYENAPEENPNKPCEWTFKPDSYYYYSAEEVEKMDTSNDNEGIEATVIINGIPYGLSASRRDKDDFKINSISVFPNSGTSPHGMDDDHFQATLCRTEKPSDDAMREISINAQNMLDAMELGDWLVDDCYLETIEIGSATEYVVHVTAVPVFAGVPAIRRPQFGNLKSDAAYASNYYLTDVEFKFSARGDLLSFSLHSAIDMKCVINDNAATLTMDELIEKAKTHMSLSEAGEFGLPQVIVEDMEQNSGENIVCRVSITELEYGLTRVKAPNTDDSYYYVPAIFLKGTSGYFGADSGEQYGEEIMDNGLSLLLVLNAIDGTVVEIYNG